MGEEEIWVKRKMGEEENCQLFQKICNTTTDPPKLLQEEKLDKLLFRCNNLGIK